mgnify:CR=1 FL=1|jgi:hypothetical protein
MTDWLTPDVATALGAGLGALLLAIGIRGKAPGNKTPAPHQAIARPDTRSEIRSADALEKIAATLDLLERHASIFLDRKQR